VHSLNGTYRHLNVKISQASNYGMKANQDEGGQSGVHIMIGGGGGLGEGGGCVLVGGGGGGGGGGGRWGTGGRKNCPRCQK